MNEEMINLENLNGEEVWEKLYNKELNTKKNILEFIEMTKVLKKNADVYTIESTYNFIYRNIDKMSNTVKPNTIMYLQNALKAQLGKFVTVKDPKFQSTFVEFFKEAYPKGERRKDFTWVLMDLDKIVDEQIWNTLKYINSYCLEGGILNEDAKTDIIREVEKLVLRKNLTYINNVRSLEALNKALEIKIISSKGDYVVKKLKK